MNKGKDLTTKRWKDLEHITWREVRLEEIADINMGQSPKSIYYNNLGEGIRFLQGNRTFGRIYPTFDTYTTKITKLANKGDILFTVRAPVGDMNIANYDLCIGRGIVAIRGKENHKFLYYSLIHNTEFLKTAENGTTYGSINKSDLENFKIEIPDLKTQEKIADILSTYDRLIENNNRRIEILEKTAEEIYKEWFVRMRFPGHDNTKFIKGIPEEWEVKRVGDLAKFKRGKNLVIRDAIPGEVPVIAGGMEPSCYHNESNTNAPVITVSASGANAGYTQLNHVNVWASDCSYIDINDTDLVYYIYLLLKVSHKEILNLQLGSAQPHVYARDLNNFKFLKPDRKLIKEINSYAKDIFEKIKYLSSTNQNLIKQRDLLLPRLMNGTIEVK